MAEHERLLQVASGRAPSVLPPRTTVRAQPIPVVTPAPAPVKADEGSEPAKVALLSGVS